MEITSHYYGILALCRCCGVDAETAQKIAQASQFVDDAKINCITVEDDFADVLVTEEGGGRMLNNIATCHSYHKINTFNYQAMINNTSAFHFVPGCEGDTFTGKMICREDSQVIRDIVEEALSGDPERFGMVMHVYADTFAHQKFSGLISKENDIKNLKPGKIHYNFVEHLSSVTQSFFKETLDKLLDTFVPAYGHGQATSCPDIPYLEWSYEYDPSASHNGLSLELEEVDNRDRYTRAFGKIKGYMERYLEQNPRYKDEMARENYQGLLDVLLTPAPKMTKIAMWRKYMINNGYFNDGDAALVYDEDLWLREFFSDYDKERYKERIVRGAKINKDHQKYSWYKFITGVKWYKQTLFEKCRLKGLDIPQ